MSKSIILRSVFTLSVILAWSDVIHAGSNTLLIQQIGITNTITTNQSAASKSTIGGLTLSQSTTTYQNQFEAPPANIASPTVEPVFETMEPVFEVRSAGMLDFRSTDIALQRGAGNTASATLSGFGGTVGLFQDSGLADLGNSATINALGGSSALVGQIGAGNTAVLDVDNGSRGAILQKGDGNTADLGVYGVSSNGLISQIGSNNSTTLDVVGNNTSVSYVVEGNNLSTVGDTALQVTTNAVSVQVTQGTFTGR